MKKITSFFLVLLLTLLVPLGMANAQEEDYYDITEYEYDSVLYEAPDSYEYDESFFLDSEFGDAQDTFTIADTGLGYMTPALLAGFAAFSIFYIVLILIVYIFTSLALMKIGKNLNYENSWFAWIPILSGAMLLQLGGFSGWLILLSFIPFINLIVLVISVIALMNITEKLGYNKLLALIIFIPFGAFVLFYLLAWKPKNMSIQKPIETSVQPISEVPTQ